MSLKIEKHEKIAMLAISALNTISNLISKPLSDDSISDKEYSLISLELETLSQIKEDLRINYKTSFEKTGNIENEACELRRRIRLVIRLEFVFKTMFKTMFKIMLKTMLKTVLETTFKTMFEPRSKNKKYSH